MDDAKIVEVSFFGGKVLVTFEDGMMALLEPGLIRRLAMEADALNLFASRKLVGMATFLI
jgi:hypothetical protein